MLLPALESSSGVLSGAPQQMKQHFTRVIAARAMANTRGMNAMKAGKSELSFDFVGFVSMVALVVPLSAVVFQMGVCEVGVTLAAAVVEWILVGRIDVLNVLVVAWSTTWRLCLVNCILSFPRGEYNRKAWKERRNSGNQYNTYEANPPQIAMTCSIP